MNMNRGRCEEVFFFLEKSRMCPDHNEVQDPVTGAQLRGQ